MDSLNPSGRENEKKVNRLILFKNLRDVLSQMKRDSKPCIICPQCGSSKIQAAGSLDGWITPERYNCLKCGYNGSLLIEIDKKDLEEKDSDTAKSQE